MATGDPREEMKERTGTPTLYLMGKNRDVTDTRISPLSRYRRCRFTHPASKASAVLVKTPVPRQNDTAQTTLHAIPRSNRHRGNHEVKVRKYANVLAGVGRLNNGEEEII